MKSVLDKKIDVKILDVTHWTKLEIVLILSQLPFLILSPVKTGIKKHFGVDRLCPSADSNVN